MNFGLSTKYPEIDFEAVRPADLQLIGGGCGGDVSGGTWVQSVQTAVQSAAAAPGANGTVSATVVGGSGGSVSINYCYTTAQGGVVNGSASVQSPTGNVTVTIPTVYYPPGAPGSTPSWSSVGSFFSWLFGSH
jgi:hypothetical protein